MNQWTTPRDVWERFFSKIDRSGGTCWLWTGTVGANGYGYFDIKTDGRWKKFLAHRVSFEFHHRPLTAGETVDHLCMNPRCVNPEHLDACTIGENSKRSARTLCGANVRKTHCPKGHPYAGDNLFYDQGKRRCRACVRAKNRAADARRRAARKHGDSPPA